MGQPNASRIQYLPREIITDGIDSNIHTLQAVDHLVVGDIVDIWEIDPVTKKRLSVIESDITILSVNPGNKKVTFSTSFDTSGLTGQPIVRVDNIDDSQEAIERLYRRSQNANSISFDLRQNILDFEADQPSAGKGLYDVDDAQFWEPGDEVTIIDDDGIVITSTTIFAVNVNADDANNKSTIAVNDNTVVNLGTNPYIQNLSLSVDEVLRRTRDRVDEIDLPKKNQALLQLPDNSQLAFEFPDLFLAGSTDVFIDGNKKTKGATGTRATLVQGTGNGALTLHSMILNTKGNATQVAVTNAPGLTVTVGGNSQTGYTVTANNNSGAATAKQVADAINANAIAKRIVQAVYGGDGSSSAPVFVATSLAGGLNDSTFDYAEIEQVFENKIVGTGFKWISFNILNGDPNRMNKAPKDSEELVIGYSKAHRNIDK